MPHCVICDSSYSFQGWSAPAEPCDCGQEIDRRTADEMDPAVVRELQRRWQAQESMPAEEDA